MGKAALEALARYLAMELAAQGVRVNVIRSGMIEPDGGIIPVSGTREALFMMALTVVPQPVGGKAPVVLMPNPVYLVYVGAAVLAGAEPGFLPATVESGFLPDLEAVDAEQLDRTALVYYCSPANPQGTVADLEAIAQVRPVAVAGER